MTKHSLPLAVFVLGLLSAACSTGGGNGDAGIKGLPDICNTPDSGMAQCELNVLSAPPSDAGPSPCQQFYIDHTDKDLWLWMQLPSTLPAGTLYSIVAGYEAASTAVVLSLNLTEADTKTGLGSVTANQSPTGKPGIITYQLQPDPTKTPPGSLVWLDFHDATHAHDDIRNSFCAYAYASTDPDPNSATTPTTVSFGAASGGIQNGTCATTSSGACNGVLSTPGRIDTYTVTIPGTGNQILYTDITGPTLTPPPAYLLSFTILNSNKNVLNSGQVPNADSPINLPSSLLVQGGSTYTIQVQGLDPTTSEPPGAPDLRLTYTLQLELMPNLDTNAPAVGQAFAAPVAFSGDPSGGTISMPQSGRLSYLGQKDWFYLKFPATSGPTRLHYKFTPTTTGNRFPAFGPMPPDRLANLMIDIPPLPDGGSSSSVCLNNTTVCPIDPEYADYMLPDSGTLSYQSQLIQQLCAEGDGDGGSFCALSSREEFTADSEGFTPLQNFEGIVPLIGNGAQGMVLEYLSAGSQYVDDLPYTVTLDWESMPNPLSSVNNPLSFGTLGSGNTTQSGTLSVGYGYLVQYDQNNNLSTQDVRGQQDYDAVPSSADVWEVGIPAGFQGAPLGATWGLSWTATAANGMPAESVILSVLFCDSKGCVAAGPQRHGVTGAIYYAGGDDLPWWDPSGSGWYIPYQQFGTGNETLFDVANVSGGQSYTFTPFSCTCIQPDYLPAGKFYVTVLGADRTAWTDTDYSLSMSISNYPQTFQGDGGSIACPISMPEPLKTVDAGGTLVDAGSPQGCQFISGFKNQKG